MNASQLDYILTLIDECHKRACWPHSRPVSEWGHLTWWRRVLTLREYNHLNVMPPPSYIAYIEAELANAALVSMPTGDWQAVSAGLATAESVSIPHTIRSKELNGSWSDEN